jgi:hypothetical protein
MEGKVERSQKKMSKEELEEANNKNKNNNKISKGLLADKHRPRCGFSVEMCLS